MSGDHNMNQTDSGWRKRQIALDKMAENARELGLDYEIDKTIMQMARESWLDVYGLAHDRQSFIKALEAFAALIREEATAEANAKSNASWAMMCEKMVVIEREACAKVCESRMTPGTGSVAILNGAAAAIRARGEQA